MLERHKANISKSDRDVSATTVKASVSLNAADYSFAVKTPKKRGRENRDPSDIPLGDRLNIPFRDTPVASDSGQSLTQLLMQGLQSKDRDILDKVLRVGNDATIKGTVKRLPVEYVAPLLSVLTSWLTERVNVSS